MQTNLQLSSCAAQNANTHIENTAKHCDFQVENTAKHCDFQVKGEILKLAFDLRKLGFSETYLKTLVNALNCLASNVDLENPDMASMLIAQVSGRMATRPTSVTSIIITANTTMFVMSKQDTEEITRFQRSHRKKRSTR